MSLSTAFFIARYGLWVLGPVLQLLLIILMVRRKLRREFPLFFAYTLFQVLSFVLKFASYHRSQLDYFFMYWVTSALSLVFGFAVIYEIFQHVFRPYDALRQLGGVLFRWAMIVLLLIAVVMAISGPQAGNANRIMTGILTMERSMRVTQCGMVLFLFLFSEFLGVSARHHIFGIAAGFGFFGAVDLLAITLLTLGKPEPVTVSLIRSVAYNLTVLLWTWYMVRPEPARRPARYEVAERWNFALAGVRHSDEKVAYISSLESTVERVLTRTNGKHA